MGTGQIALGRGPVQLTAVLGSCVGVVLHHAWLQLGDLGHVVLPAAHGRPTSAGKFTDTAIPAMIAMLQERGTRKSESEDAAFAVKVNFGCARCPSGTPKG
jgi:chemotaxis protein CheD